jgi:hypothetical protein
LTRTVEVEERVGNWLRAFTAIRVELTPPAQRTTLAKMEEVEGIAQLSSYMSLARNVMANDRAAAYVAGLLTATGIKPAPMDFEDSGEVG